MSWSVDGEPQLVSEREPTRWAHTLRDTEGNTRTIAVSITGTAMTASGVSDRVARARNDEGRSEVERVLEWIDWEEPPREIRFDSASVYPHLTLADGQVLRKAPF